MWYFQEPSWSSTIGSLYTSPGISSTSVNGLQSLFSESTTISTSHSLEFHSLSEISFLSAVISALVKARSHRKPYQDLRVAEQPVHSDVLSNNGVPETTDELVFYHEIAIVICPLMFPYLWLNPKLKSPLKGRYFSQWMKFQLTWRNGCWFRKKILLSPEVEVTLKFLCIWIVHYIFILV